MKTSDLRRKLEDSGFDHDEVEEFVNTWAEEENDRQRDENLVERLERLERLDKLDSQPNEKKS